MIRVTKIQIPTLPTEKPRRLYVYTPRDYDRTERRYPVLYMFDGHNVFYDRHATYGKSWGMREFLARTKLPLILVAVECNPEGFRRLSEYSPWDFKARGFSAQGQGKLTMDWIVDCLKPEIDRTCRTLPDREHTMIAGSSMGGLMALYAAVAYNGTFSRAAALSPSLWVVGNRLPELLKAHPLAEPTRIYMDCGSAEAEPRWRNRMLGSMFAAAKTLTTAGASVAARTVPDAKHSEAYWETRIPVFFEYLCGDEFFAQVPEAGQGKGGN